MKLFLLFIVSVATLTLASCSDKAQEQSREVVSRDASPEAKSSPKSKESKSAPIMFGITPSRNFVNTTDKGLITDFQPAYKKKQPAKNVKWTAAVGTHAYGGPLVAGGRIFVATNNDMPRDPNVDGDKGILMCFDQKTGEFLWQAVHDKLDNPSENDYQNQGIASTPAVDGDRVYYVSNRCELVCADVVGDPKTKQAKFHWKLDMMTDLKVYPHYLAVCSPLIVGDVVYVVTGNGVEDENHTVSNPEAPSFIAVDKNKGTVLWHKNYPGKNIMDGSWSNPTYAEIDGKGQVLCPGGDGWLYSLVPKTGELIWKFNCNPASAKYKVGGRGDKNYFLATPVVYDKKVYIGVGQDPQYGGGLGHLWCIDLAKKPDNKEKDLSIIGDAVDPKSPQNKDSGLVWHFGGEINPKPDEGREYYFGRTMSLATIHDDLLYIADLDGVVYCMDAKTGKKYWDYDCKTEIWASPYWVDGKVLIGTATTGELFIFNHGKTLDGEPKKVEMHRGM
jgi:outer membrane protein assembly factor BamB